MDPNRGITPLKLLDFDLQEPSIKQRNLYVTLFTKKEKRKKRGFEEFGVRCWDLELYLWVLVSFPCWVGKDCGGLDYLGYWIWSGC